MLAMRALLTLGRPIAKEFDDAEDDDYLRSHWQFDQAKALATLSGLVGAMVLARAVDDRKFSDEILAAAVTAFGGQPDSGRMHRLSRRRPDRFPP